LKRFSRDFAAAKPFYNHHMPAQIPREIQGVKYISLTTFRKNGMAIPTPVWFAEDDNKLYVMTRNDSGKYKRIRNNPKVRIAPCTARGKLTGPEFNATARLLPEEEWPPARSAIHRKYWLARLPFWSKKNVYLEVVAAG
jgi:PPOX class probable F420-dependent enzyme